MESLHNKLFGIGIVPVVTIHDAADAVLLADALVAGGISTVEITFRTDAAEAAIRAIAQSTSEILIGAGTVTSLAIAKRAVLAGADYLVSPGLQPDIVRWCIENGVPILPGVSTPTEVETAMNLGLDTMKFFPAVASGGIEMLKALYGPYPQLHFVPTGGITLSNLNDYLKLPNVLACGGSWMAPADRISHKEFDVIRLLCAESVQRMHGFHLLHVGINAHDGEEAKAVSAAFSGMFGLPVIDFPSSLFAGTMIEVMKQPFLGEKGHIAIGCNDVERAMAHFTARGLHFREQGMAKDEKGIVAVYFEQELGGFALHLRRRL